MAGKTACETCGQVHVCASRPNVPCCTGHLSSDKPDGRRKGDPCHQPARRGQTKCRVHGGNAPAALAKAERRIAEEESAAHIARLARTLGEPGDDAKDPAEIVTEQIRWRHVHVQWLRNRVQDLEPEALTWGRTKEKDGGDDHGTTSEAKPHIWYVLYMEASRDLEKLCIDAIRAGLEERRVRIAESQADMLVTVLDGMLRELGHDPNDPATAGVVERHLRVAGNQ